MKNDSKYELLFDNSSMISHIVNPEYNIGFAETLPITKVGPPTIMEIDEKYIESLTDKELKNLYRLIMIEIDDRRIRSCKI